MVTSCIIPTFQVLLVVESDARLCLDLFFAAVSALTQSTSLLQSRIGKKHVDRGGPPRCEIHSTQHFYQVQIQASNRHAKEKDAKISTLISGKTHNP